MKLLSIIIPVYKVEPYINKCLDSLIVSPQLMDKLEVIIVNDGTPDRSAEMSREYVKRFPETFRQIDKKNGGHGSAWNVGLKEATGKYLRFLDSDDWLENLDSLMYVLMQTDADLVLNPYHRVNVQGQIIDTVGNTIENRDGIITICDSFWGKSKWGLESINFWGITYKTAILQPLLPLFAEKTFYDDNILRWAALIHGRTCLSLDFPVYNYLLGRPGQSMSIKDLKKKANAYTKCFEQYENVRNRITKEDSIPTELLSCIDSLIAKYPLFFFYTLPFASYKTAKRRCYYFWNNYLRKSPEKSKVLKRFKSMPFPLFYSFEHLRMLVNTRIRCKNFNNEKKRTLIKNVYFL